MSSQVVEVVLTGGPGAGKSSSLSYLSQKLRDRGLRVLVAPELASQLILGGLDDLPSLRTTDPAVYQQVQRQMIAMQQLTHRAYRAIAESFSGQPTVILYDRAEMDISAYTDPHRWQALLDEQHLSLAEIRDCYDAVIHLVSAADGAEEHYAPKGNPARIESDLDAARAADKRTLKAWTGHPHLRIIDNSTSFDEKLARVLAEILRLCAHLIPGSAALAPLEYERKYLLRAAPDFSLPPMREAAAIEIKQTYLMTAETDSELRVRRRAQDGQATYYLTRKIETEGDGRLEEERRISPGEYLELLEGADPDRSPINKTRFCFAYESFYFEMDALLREDGSTLWVLEIETPGPQVEIIMPPGIDVLREVTDDPQFRNSYLARQTELDS